MYAHKNRRDDRCRIAIERLAIRHILRTDFCGQGCYSNIDFIFNNRCQQHGVYVMLPHIAPIEAPSTAGSALARFDPIVAKNVLNLLAMIDV